MSDTTYHVGDKVKAGTSGHAERNNVVNKVGTIQELATCGSNGHTIEFKFVGGSGGGSTKRSVNLFDGEITLVEAATGVFGYSPCG